MRKTGQNALSIIKEDTADLKATIDPSNSKCDSKNISELKFNN